MNTDVDIGARLFAQGIGGGATGGKGGSDPDHIGDVLTDALGGAFASWLKAIGAPGSSIVSGAGSSSMAAGFTSDGHAGKEIRPTQNLSGGDGFMQKLWAMLKKGGLAIQDMTAGIGPVSLPEGLNYGSGMDISPSLLGSLSPPSVGDMSIGRGSGISYDMA